MSFLMLLDNHQLNILESTDLLKHIYFFHNTSEWTVVLTDVCNAGIDQVGQQYSHCVAASSPTNMHFAHKA